MSPQAAPRHGRPIRRRTARRAAARGRRASRRFFKTPRGLVHAVDGVSLTLERGKTLGIVGESGSASRCSRGRSWVCCPATSSGTAASSSRATRSATPTTTRCAHYWGTQMSMVFQDPMTSLNPVMRIGKQITESLRYHLDVSRDYAERHRAGAARSRSGSPRPSAACASTRTSSPAACASA